MPMTTIDCLTTRPPGTGPGPMGRATNRCAVDWVPVRARDTGAEAPGEEWT
jgi:hypothetical protein